MKIRQHPKVVVMERCNARYLESLPEPVELIVGDVSFISITKILPAMKRIAAPNALGVLLIKPQFEVGRTGTVDGLVKDPKVRQEAIDRVTAEFVAGGCKIVGHVHSSIAGAKKGNVEELSVLTLSCLSYLSCSLLCLLIFSGCAETTTPPLPDSALEVESWLQTSRKVRYSIDPNTQWEGWVLHSPNPTSDWDCFLRSEYSSKC